jgi:hypothetical protein
MTPAYFVVLYVLAILTILGAVKLKRRPSTSWQRCVPRQLVGAQPAQFAQLSTESTTTKRDDRGLVRRANENTRKALRKATRPVIAKAGQEKSTASEQSLNFCPGTNGHRRSVQKE